MNVVPEVKECSNEWKVNGRIEDIDFSRVNNHVMILLRTPLFFEESHSHLMLNLLKISTMEIMGKCAHV